MAAGRPAKLVEKVWNRWPIETLPRFPSGVKGLYVLYDPHEYPVRVGIAGNGKQDVKRRLTDYYKRKKWRHVTSFSVYKFKTTHHFKQMEVLFLHALGQHFVGNIRGGRFLKTTKVVKRPRGKSPQNFVRKTVGKTGVVNLRGYKGRQVRIDVGPRPQA